MRHAQRPTLIDANFNINTDSFTYRDDAFRGTARPNYADGRRDANNGYNNSGGPLASGSHTHHWRLQK